MFKLNVARDVNRLLTTFSTEIMQNTQIFNKPYNELGRQAKKIVSICEVAYPKEIKWEYVLDEETGLEILKSDKDPKALDQIREMADNLFK